MTFFLKYFFARLLILFLKKIRLIYNKNKNCFLLYHSIVEEKISKNDNLDLISLSNFKEQCKYLKLRYHNRLNKIEDFFDNQPSIILTFDDGYKTVLTNVMPIIEKYQISIIVFICPELVGKKGYLNLNEIKKIYKSKFVSIGLHGYKHIYYGNTDLETFKDHLKLSKQWFEKNIDSKFTKYFSFPFGSYNQKMIDYIKNNFYFEYYFTSYFGTCDIRSINKNFIPRVSIWNIDKIEAFDEKINGLWNFINKFIKNNENKN